MSFVRNVSLTFITRIGILIVTLATSVIIARTLGPEGKGLYSLVVLVAFVVLHTTHLGIGSGSGYFLGRKGVSLELLAGSWFSISLVIGCVSLGLSLLVVPRLVLRLLPDVPVRLVIIALFSIPFALLAANMNALFRANNDFRRYNALAGVAPVSLLAILSVLLFVYPGSKIEAAVVAFLVAYVIAGLAAVGLIMSVVKLRFHWVKGLMRKALAFGIQAHFASFLEYLSLRIDLVLINFFMQTEHVGFYTISVVLVEKIWIVPEVLSVVLHPRVAHSGDEEANRLTSIVCRNTLVVTLLGCAGILVFGRFLIQFFYGDSFLPSVSPLYLLLPGVIATGLSRIIRSDMLARGYPRLIFWSGLVALCTNVVLNVILIPRYGIDGAAVATSISYSLNFIILISAFTYLTGTSLISLLVLRSSDLGLLVKRLRAESSERNDSDS